MFVLMIVYNNHEVLEYVVDLLQNAEEKTDFIDPDFTDRLGNSHLHKIVNPSNIQGSEKNNQILKIFLDQRLSNSEIQNGDE